MSVYPRPPSEPQVWAVFPEMRQTEGGRCFPVLPEEAATHVESGLAGHIKHTMCTLHVTVCACAHGVTLRRKTQARTETSSGTWMVLLLTLIEISLANCDLLYF